MRGAPVTPPPPDEIADERPFSRRALGWVIGLCGVSIVAGLGLAVFGSDLDRPRTDGGDAFSRSALGHGAFVDLLGRLGLPVVVSRYAPARHAAAGLLVLAEPGDPERTAALARLVPAVLVVLPKWRGRSDPRHPGWVTELDLVPVARPEAVLRALAPGARVVRRPDGGTGWRDPEALAPALAEAQLVEGEGLVPLLACDDGVLLAEVARPAGAGETRRVVVCADPDLLATHGLFHGDNAWIAVRTVLELQPPGGPIVIDETLHGHALAPSIWRAFVRPPLLLVSAHFAAFAGILLWLTLGRFGPPVPAPPAIEPGKRYLVTHTAALQRLGGHTAHALRAYLVAAQRDVAARVHLPEGLPPPERRRRLAAVGRARGVSVDLETLDTGASEADAAPTREPRLLDVARAVHRWRREMLRGA